MTDRILVRVDYDGTHDGTWIECAPHEPPIEYTGSEPQYLLSTPLRESAPDLLEELSNLLEEMFDIRGIDVYFYKPHAIDRARKAIAKARGLS